VLGYLRARGITLDRAIATAFFYALRSETRDLGREATPAERDAYLFLIPFADHEALYRIAHPKVPREHFLALDRALRAAQSHGDLLAVNLGSLEYPDLVAEMADRLLSFDGARTVLCMGRYAGAAYLSLRTDAATGRAGTIMRSIVGADGAAGGHGTMAGARLSVPIGSDEALKAAYTRIVERACAALGRPVDGRPLI
jgi:nanoRNase/pAp phosphatase (c-di-AMP/oligoRNAs hydrolase)